MSNGHMHRPVNQTFRLYQTDDFGYGGASGILYGDAPGGDVEIHTAGAALNIGDVVYLSGAFLVNKSATAGTTLGKLVGVVVGGKLTDMRANTRKLDIGIQAAAANDPVIVLVRGKYFVVAAAAASAGDIIAADTATAGRVMVGTVTTDLVAGSNGNIVGNYLEAPAGAASVVLARIRIV